MTRFINLLLLLTSVFGVGSFAYERERLTPFDQGVIYASTVVGLGSFYYVSDSPLLLNGIYILSYFLNWGEDPAETLYVTSFPLAYNLLLEPSDVGPEGRPRVFLMNAGLMVAGHYTYKWFFKKDSAPKDPMALHFEPILSSDFNGVMVRKGF